jgi:putative transposase
MKMMARLPRLNIPNIPQHVIQRVNNRQVCFFAEQDYTVYLDKLGHYASKLAVRIHAFTLMTKHGYWVKIGLNNKSSKPLVEQSALYSKAATENLIHFVKREINGS